jgi:hypothetical protein
MVENERDKRTQLKNPSSRVKPPAAPSSSFEPIVQPISTATQSDVGNTAKLPPSPICESPELSLRNVTEVVDSEEELSKTPGEGSSSQGKIATTESMGNDLPLEYHPIKPGSKQIRVLSILESPGSNHDFSSEIINCSLETVDLDDWTQFYRFTSEAFFHVYAPEENLQDKLTLWRVANYLQQANNLPKYDSEQRDAFSIRNLKAKWFQEVRKQFETPDNAPIADIDITEPRFKWGDYIALSYVWGNPAAKEYIFVNGHRFAVTKNLSLALQRLQQSAEVRERRLKIWINAICINQNDDEERASEVKKMAAIYSEAFAVRGWVGLPGMDSIVELLAAKDWLSQVRHQFSRHIS